MVETPYGVPAQCRCRTWRTLRGEQRDAVLDVFMGWAWTHHEVQLKMLARGEHVAVCEIVAAEPGHGRGGRVLDQLCRWADCAGVTLELSPTDQWGVDVDRLTRFYLRYGFEPNREPRQRFVIQEDLIRYPVPGGGHA